MRRNDFPILTEKVHGQPLVYLDNAATSQKPQQVIDAIVEAYTHWNSNIHRGVHYLSQLATIKHEQARQTVAQFIGAQSSEEIIFTKGTTDSINTLAFCFGEYTVHENDEIIVSGLEHHSNIVPWQMLCERKKAVLRVIPLRDDLTLDIDAFKQFINPRTRLVSVAQVSNVLGTIQPVEEIIRLAHEHGVPVCIDAAQSVPHMPVNVQELDCDFLTFSAHKLYGPTGIGVLYGKKQWLDQLPPYQGGGEMIAHVRWDGTTYNQLPFKFEAGTPDFIGSWALKTAIDYLQQQDMHVIEIHEHELMRYCENQLASIPGLTIYAANQPKAGVLSFNIYRDGQLLHPFDIGTLLDQQGIAVRTGHHCAEPLIDHLHLPGTVRVSIGLYSDRTDIYRLIQALHKAIEILS